MSRDVVPQVDVGVLAGRGLAAVAPLLAAVTADNVDFLAVVRLGELGELYRINGPYARKVPDLLRRCSSVRLERIGVMIGWRKGDTASFLGQSAGGQAVSLLCLCLTNTCQQSQLGEVLSDLLERAFPDGKGISSVTQLQVGAKLLASKLQDIGFGNILAQEVLKIQKACESIGKVLPSGFFVYLTRESAVDLYYALSGLSTEKGTVLFISGSHAMGHIITVCLIMFNDNVSITIDSLIMRQGESPSVFLNIDTTESQRQLTTIRKEERLEFSATNPRLIEIKVEEPGCATSPYHFEWSGHVTGALRIAFAAARVELTEALVLACCDLLLSLILSSTSNSHSTSPTEATLPLNGFLDLLGSEPAQRCRYVCQTVFGLMPGTRHVSVETAYQQLEDMLISITESATSCVCTQRVERNTTNDSGLAIHRTGGQSIKECLHSTLQRYITSALNRALAALLINTGPNASTVFDITSATYGNINSDSPRHLNQFKPIEHLLTRFSHCGQIHQWLLSTIGSEATDFVDSREPGALLAVSDGSSSVYPTSINTLKLDMERGVRYELREGQMFVKGHRYDRLVSVSSKPRRRAYTSLDGNQGRIAPSCIGEHSQVTFNIRPAFGYAELSMLVTAQGHIDQLDLHQVLCASMGLNDAPECSHNPKDDLAPKLLDHVWSTSVAMPKARRNKIALVQTKGNSRAQFLACEPGTGLLLLRKCCLDCAVIYAKRHDLSQIIVAS